MHWITVTVRLGIQMIQRTIAVWLAICCVLPTGTWAQDDPGEQLPRPQLEQVALADVLDAVSRNDDRSFLIDHRVAPTVVIGQTEMRDIDYSTLLVILRNNDMAAVDVHGVVNVIPVSIVRQFALPVLHGEDDSIHDEEWVTWIIQTQNAPPNSIVPIIRPIMPAAGHFAANVDSKSMLLVDRYGNAKRIVALIEQLDAATVRQR